MNRQHLALMIHEQIFNRSYHYALFYKKGGRWRGITWKAMGLQIEAAAKALLRMGVGHGQRVAIYSPNRPQWLIVDYAIQSIGAVCVPIYATNTAQQAEFIINDAEIRVIFVDGQEHLERILPLLASNKYLKNIVVFDDQAQYKKNLKVMSYRGFLRFGEEAPSDKDQEARLRELSPDDVSTLIYTSGTTGNPKGVILTHANLFFQFEALDQRFVLGQQDVELSFLPLSHAYGRVSNYWVQSHGATIYYCNDPKQIVDYFKEVRPTYMVGVPRLYEKIYAAIYQNLEAAPTSKKKLFQWAIATGLTYQYKRHANEFISPLLKLQHTVADRLVLSKIREGLGGRLNFFSAGGAPLSKALEEFFFAVGIFLAQGYGLTETSPMVTCNSPSVFRFGSAGKAIPGCEIKIAGDGEILVKGRNVSQGYYRKPQKNKETFTEDGWFMTGDIGHLDEDGFLFITDRKKDLIVTAGGKNIAPQRIESIIGQDFYIEQIVVIGDDRRFLSALIVPAFESLEQYARQEKIAFSSTDELIRIPQIIDFIQSRIDHQQKDLARYEQIKKFTLMAQPFAQEADEITPTFKIKRRNIQQRYKKIIDEMYLSSK